MRKSILVAVLILFTSIFVLAQEEPPAGAGDTSLRDDNIKLRSVELERVKREADRLAMIRREDGIELNFSLIKNDFEGIQKEQDKIIKAYTMSKKINYKKINKSAGKITEMAIRLKANLFQPADDEKDSANDSKKDETANTGRKSVRNLIIDLDNSIGSLVTNKMFQKLKVIDVVLSEKAKADLNDIIKLSSDLWLESNRMKRK